MAAERRSLQAGASPHHGLSEEDQLRIRALRASELEARNKSASGALETYYSIAEAEANLSILAASLAEIDDAASKIKRLRGQGMQIPFDDSEFARQRIDLIDRQTELELKVGQLNAQLVRLLGLQTTDPEARIWPATDWKVAVEPIDMDAAVQEGLSLRPEMQFLATLPRYINVNTLGVTRQIVSGASGLLGSQSKFTGLMELFGLRDLFGRGEAKERELPVRRRQLADFTQQRRLEITSEIQQGVRTVEARLREIAIAKQQAQAWERRIAELRGKQKIDEASFAEISSARLKAFQAQSDETHRVVGWKIAQAKLKEAQGKLVLECPAESFDCPPSAPMLAAPAPTPPATATEQRNVLISSRTTVVSRPEWTPGDNHRR
jgi:outer membrane protein TolC